MTEIETAKLLSDLAAVAKQLNKESDSLNDILDAWEEKLDALNIGLEAWVPISSEEQTVTVEDWDPDAGREVAKEVPGSVDIELGWVKYANDNAWQLMARQVTYRDDHQQGWQEIGRNAPQPIHSAPREVRIEALEVLPKLLQRLKQDAEAAVAKIARAKKLVK